MIDDSLLQAWAVGGSWQGPLPILGRIGQQALLLVVAGSLALGFGVGIFRRGVLAKQGRHSDVPLPSAPSMLPDGVKNYLEGCMDAITVHMDAKTNAAGQDQSP